MKKDILSKWNKVLKIYLILNIKFKTEIHISQKSDTNTL